MGRAPCCDKTNVKRGPWSPEEDATLKSYIQQNGTGGNWIALPPKIGLKRCGKSCRLRWLNYLRPNLKHGGFSDQEDNLICNLYLSIGSRWSLIAAQLPGRTDNDIKNYWNTRLKKKLFGQQKKDHQIMKKEQETTQHQYHHQSIINPIINWPNFSTTTTLVTPSQELYQDQESIISFQNPNDHKYEISPRSQVNGYINLYDDTHFDHDLYYSTRTSTGINGGHMGSTSTMIYDPNYNDGDKVVGDQSIMVQDMFDELLSNYPIDHHVVEDDVDDQQMIMPSQTGTHDWSSALNHHEQVNNYDYFEKSKSCWEEMDPIL